MAEYELPLAPNYVMDWKVEDAIREIIQNAIDQEVTISDNIMGISYDKEQKELRITNKSSILNPSTLVLGNSTKQGDDDTIGKFGEGYKLGMLVLIREGKNVLVENYGRKEIWEVRNRKSRKWGSDVLLVKTVKKKFWESVPNNNLTFIISDISEEEYETIKSNTMRLKENITLKKAKMGNLLLDEIEKGRVYVNGLYVTKLNNLKYGYDILPKHLKIGRDRNLLNSFDITAITSQIILETLSKEDAIELHESDYSDMSRITESYMYTGLKFEKINSAEDYSDEKTYEDVDNLNKDFISAYYKKLKNDNVGKTVIVQAPYKEVPYKFNSNVVVKTVSDAIYEKLMEDEEYSVVYNKEVDKVLKSKSVDLDSMYKAWRDRVENRLSDRDISEIDFIVQKYKGSDLEFLKE